MNEQWLEFWYFPQVLTFSDSEVGLLVLSTDIGIVLKIYTNAAHFQWMKRFNQMLDGFAQQSLLMISILRIVCLHFGVFFFFSHKTFGVGNHTYDLCVSIINLKILILILQPKKYVFNNFTLTQTFILDLQNMVIEPTKTLH